MTEVFINIVSGEGGPTLRSIYENVSKNHLFAMFVRVNLSMIVYKKVVLCCVVLCCVVLCCVVLCLPPLCEDQLATEDM